MINSSSPRTSSTTRRRRAVLAGGLAVGVAVLALPALPASAHVRVHADNTTTGGFSALTFRVPNESDSARTTKLSVELPQSTPFLSVSTKPVPGWRVSTTTAALPKPVETDGTTITKAVRTITWTADSPSASIGPGEYQEFSASVGPLPAPGTIVLPATQTYSDGTVVRWNQSTKGGTEPENPAPELVITSASPTAAPTASSNAGPTDSRSGTGSVSSGADDTARVLGAAGLVVGLIGVVVGVLGLRRARRLAS